MIPAIIAAFGAIGGTIAQLIANGRREEAAELARQHYKDVPIPQEIQQLFGPTELQPDVGFGETRDSQIDALRRLSQISNAGGLDAQAVSGISHAQNAANQASQGRLGAIRAQLARQGGSSSATGALMQQQAAQAASNAAAQQGLDIQAQAQQRALQALLAKGQMAGQTRGQDEVLMRSNQAARAERDRFNAQLRAAGANAQLQASQLGMQRAAGLAGQQGVSGQIAKDQGDIINRGINDVGNVALTAYEASREDDRRRPWDGKLRDE